MLQILEDSKDSAFNIMQRDQKLFQSLSSVSTPILRFYEWERPSLTYGYFIHPERWLHTQILQEEKIDMARRPTGGGVVFHMWDLAFSFLLPSSSSFFSLNTLKNYRFVNQLVFQALHPLLMEYGILSLLEDASEDIALQNPYFCMARPTQYDLIYEGKKIAGAAQRKGQQGFLHQGTISILAPNFSWLYAVIKEEKIVHGLQRYTYSFLKKEEDFPPLKERIKDRLKHVFSARFCADA